MTDKVENEETEIHEFEVNEDEFVIIPPDGNMAYISVWDDVLDDDHCDRLIDLFNQVKHAHTKIEIGDVKNFTELNFFSQDIGKSCEEESVSVLGKVSEYVESYRRHNNIMFFPPQCHNEEIKMKKYSAGGKDEVKYHTDVGDYPTARRFLTCQFYLNTVEEGGETVFPDYNTSVEAKKGRLAIFPPFWTHPFTEQPVVSNDKYTLGTFLHYM